MTSHCIFFNRCISDHGRETRFPFLDENVVDFLESLNVCVKVIIDCFCCCEDCVTWFVNIQLLGQNNLRMT